MCSSRAQIVPPERTQLTAIGERSTELANVTAGGGDAIGGRTGVGCFTEQVVERDDPTVGSKRLAVVPAAKIDDLADMWIASSKRFDIGLSGRRCDDQCRRVNRSAGPSAAVHNIEYPCRPSIGFRPH